ncbi:hypothetical protein T492DRAFT_283336 [Pavlovales sp. CCMP2436]|nr:hypothetical protein T492DRAFT_283336 [Pavlovales sp. CCMP2436]
MTRARFVAERDDAGSEISHETTDALTLPCHARTPASRGTLNELFPKKSAYRASLLVQTAAVVFDEAVGRRHAALERDRELVAARELGDLRGGVREGVRPHDGPPLNRRDGHVGVGGRQHDLGAGLVAPHAREGGEQLGQRGVDELHRLGVRFERRERGERERDEVRLAVGQKRGDGGVRGQPLQDHEEPAKLGYEGSDLRLRRVELRELGGHNRPQRRERLLVADGEDGLCQRRAELRRLERARVRIIGHHSGRPARTRIAREGRVRACRSWWEMGGGGGGL